MFAKVETTAPADRVRAIASRLGLWTGCLTALLTVVSFSIAILTPPRSGPFCTGACSMYPYSDTAAFFPADYRWIFPSILMTPFFLILCACTHSLASAERRIFSRLALLFAAIATAMITLDYFVQIEVVQPSLLKAETAGLALFSQYNPHGIFIAMEDLGYLMMTAAFFFLGAALSPDSRVECVLQRLLMASSLVAFATFSGISLYFGVNLETRFELAIITISWTTLAVASILLSVLFWRALHPRTLGPVI